MKDRFYVLLNKVFSLMIKNKLREDIDDTLLEKLLSIIKSEIQNKCFADDLLKKTQTLVLLETALSSLRGNNKALSTSIVVFSLRLLGLVFENQRTFLALKNSTVLTEFSSIINSSLFVSQSPSLQDAVISSLISISKHVKGALWLIEQNFIEFVFESFSSTSYYVKKTGAKFFSSSVELWSSPEFAEYEPRRVEQRIDEAYLNILRKLISGFQAFEDPQSENLFYCCVLTLTQILKCDVIMGIEFFLLLQEIIKYFEKPCQKSKVNQSVVDLLVAAIRRGDSRVFDVEIIIQLLIKQKMFTDAFYFISTLFSHPENCAPLPTENLSLLLMPFTINFATELTVKENILELKPEEINAYLAEEMSNKSNAFNLMSSSLIALTNLTSIMDSKAINYALLPLNLAFLQPSQENMDFSVSSLENGRVCLALLEFLGSFFSSSKIYSKVDSSCKLKLLEFLMLFLKKPSMNSNIVPEALRIIKSAIALNAELKIILDDATKIELIQLLSRKLLDCKDPIVDDALHVVREIICGKDHGLWKEIILRNLIHLIIWDLAIDGHREGVIKASALKVLTDACLYNDYFHEIILAKGINEEAFMKILCDYVQDPDFFVQRESLLCACKWMKAKERCLPISCKFSLFEILLLAIQSLDMDLKLIVLDQYKELIEKEIFFPTLSHSNIDQCLELYITSNFTKTLMYAVEDYDEAVKYKAASMLFDLREKMRLLDFSEVHFKVKGTEPLKTPKLEASLDSSILVTKEERDKGIDDVMMMSTTQQLLNIYKAADSPAICLVNQVIPEEHQAEISSSISSFWKYLWSDAYEDILSTKEVNESFLSDYSFSVLEDIIAAEKTEIICDISDIPDCY